MKTCPVCNAVAFDDASTCFGCMHPFEADGPAASAKENRTGDAPTRFVVSFSPRFEGGQTLWSCSVEPAVT